MEPNDYRFPQIVISSGERQVWPDGNAFGVVLSGERQVWPDGALAANTPLGWTLLSRGWHCPWGVLLVRGWSGIIISQPEKHLWTHASLYSVLLKVYETFVHLQRLDHLEVCLRHPDSKGVFRLRGSKYRRFGVEVHQQNTERRKGRQ